MVDFETCREVETLVETPQRHVESSSLEELRKAVNKQKDSSRRITNTCENSRSENSFPRPAIFWVGFPAPLSIPTAFFDLSGSECSCDPVKVKHREYV